MSSPPINLYELHREITKDLGVYYSQTELLKELKRLKAENEKATDNFRKILIELTNNIAEIVDCSIIIDYKKDIIRIINSEPQKVIDMFIIHGYNTHDGLYRKQLLLSDDNFFLNNNYSEYISGDDSIVDRIFQFKTFWKELSDENKEIIKFYLITLISFADIRYVNFRRYIEIKKINFERYVQIFNMFDKIV